ncbi:MAG: hypothetical protein MN733_36260 [Nitrososphaera sp.]|nr:hypothetical protein [Nitrososphaera sp.]
MNITLKTLSSATTQEVFGHVASHLLRQNRQSLSPKLEYSYRGVGWLKCSAGCLMDDSEYDPSWERKTWNALIETGVVPAQHCDLIRELQLVHDRRSPDSWRESLEQVANQFNLEPIITMEQ